jgi:hypothetical protein
MRPRHTYDDSNPLEHIELHLKIEGTAAALQLIKAEQNSIAAKACRRYAASVLWPAEFAAARGDTHAALVVIKEGLDVVVVRAAIAWARAIEAREALTSKYYDPKHTDADYQRAFEIAFRLALAEADQRVRAAGRPDPSIDLHGYHDEVVRTVVDIGTQYGTDSARLARRRETHEQRYDSRRDRADQLGVQFNMDEDQDVEVSEDDAGEDFVGVYADPNPEPPPGRGVRRRRLDFDDIEDDSE